MTRSERYRRVMESLVIRDEEGNLVPMRFSASQEVLWSYVAPALDERKRIWAVVLKGRQVYCLDPATRVLTADLRWVPLDELRLGTELVSVDEHVPGGKGAARRMRVGVVQDKVEVRAPAFRIVLDDGRELVATAQHRFLVARSGRAQWATVASLKPGHSIRNVVAPWPAGDVEDGWFGGFLDGEGSLWSSGVGARIGATQAAGAVLDRACAYLNARGYTFGLRWDRREPGERSKLGSKPVAKIVVCGMEHIFRLLGQTRPARFLHQRWWDGKELPNSGWARIVVIEPVGVRRMIDIQTTTGTFVAEGVVSHNSTTFWAGLLFTRTLERGNVHSLIIAHELDTSREIFQKTLTFYEHLALPKIAPPRVRMLELPFPEGPSKIQVLSAGRVGKGHGTTQTAILCSEVAYWPRPEVLPGVFQTIPGHVGDTIWVLESTANGMVGIGQPFYEEWKAAVDGRSDLLPIFIPYYVMPKYRRSPAIPESEWDDEEKELVRQFGKYGFDGETLAWRRATINTRCQGSVELFRQYYPATPEEAFIFSGLPAFDRMAVLKQQQNICDPAFVGEMVDGRFQPKAKGWLKVWRKPEDGHQYVIGVDTAAGVRGGDYACGQVLDMNTLEQVAVIHGYIEPWEMAKQLAQLGKWYNRALVAVELTGNGRSVQDYLIRVYQYPHLHPWRGRQDAIVPTVPKLYGWECLSPDARVLTADLQWVPAKDIHPGDELLACEEEPLVGRGRVSQLRRQTVIAKETFTAPVVELTLANGQRSRVSNNHPVWTCRPPSQHWEWRRADELRPGDLVKYLAPWETARTYEAGRLSAFLDGEGHLARGKHYGFQLLITQAEGPLAEEIHHLWQTLGFEAVRKYSRRRDARHLKPLTYSGVIRLPQVLRALGVLRPSRLLEKFKTVDLSGITIKPFSSVAVERVTPVGNGPVIGLTTAPDHTLIADGIVGHNTNVQTRPLLIDAGRRAINSGLVIIHDRGTLDEINHFSRSDTGKYEAEIGHDDRVLALLIALRSREENFPAAQVTIINPYEPEQLPAGLRVLTPAEDMTRARRRADHTVAERAAFAARRWLKM